MGLGCNISVVIALALCGAAFSKWLCIAARHRRRAALRWRKVEPLREIYARYYGASTIPWEFFERNWERIAQTLYAEAGQLRPDDVLSDLSGIVSWIGSAGTTDLDVLEDMVNDSLPRDHLDKKTMHTLDDVVRALWDARVDLPT